MAALCELLTAGLVEKDSHGDVLWTWSYPAITAQQRELFSRKCGLQDHSAPFVFGRWKKNWYYIYTCAAESGTLPKVIHFSLVLVTKDFNPEKYESLSQILAKSYNKTGNPAKMLESYLAVVTRGNCNGDENGTFNVKDYDIRQAYVASSIKDVILKFGVETILLYTSLLLKKRIAVYHSSVEELLHVIRAFPTLVWHRQNWNILYPYMHLDNWELEDIQNMPVYVLGSTDPALETRTDLYDVYVNLATNQITAANHAKESLAMGKIHKDIAMFILNCAENGDKTNQQVIKDVALKTKELLTNLKSLAIVGSDGKLVVTLETLKERKMPAATENFLFNLAAAEGLVKM